MNEETKQCPYCGEIIKANAKKCRFCGEFLYNQKSYSDKIPITSIISEISGMQKTSIVLWYIFGIFMIIVGLLFVLLVCLCLCLYNEPEMRDVFDECGILNLIEVLFYFVCIIGMGVYNMVRIPSKLTEKILNREREVFEYYKSDVKFIVHLVINLCFFPFLFGWIPAIYDLRVRSVVMRNRNLFVNNKF